MTVTVQTPDGPVTGSSVIAIRVAYSESGGGLARDTQFRVRHSGEAVAVEVRPGQYLFVLHRRGLISRFFNADPERFGDLEFEDMLRTIPDTTGSVTMCPNACPDMVALVEREVFGLREVTPETMTEVFGEGYAVTEVTLDVTDDPVTTGAIAEALQWTCTDFDPERPGLRPILLLRIEGGELIDAVPYREFSTEQFCHQWE